MIRKIEKQVWCMVLTCIFFFFAILVFLFCFHFDNNGYIYVWLLGCKWWPREKKWYKIRIRMMNDHRQRKWHRDYDVENWLTWSPPSSASSSSSATTTNAKWLNIYGKKARLNITDSLDHRRILLVCSKNICKTILKLYYIQLIPLPHVSRIHYHYCQDITITSVVYCWVELVHAFAIRIFFLFTSFLFAK